MANDKKNEVGRNKNGNGSFRTNKNGKIEYRFTYKDEYGESQRKSVSGESEDECFEKARLFLEKEAKKKIDVNVYATIPEIIKERYDADLALNLVGIQGYSRNIETLKIIDRSGIGKIPIIDIEDRQVIAFYKSITHYANKTIEKIHSQMKMAFKIAHEKGMIDRDVMDNREIRKPNSSKPDKKVRGLTEDEQSKLVKLLSEMKIRKGRNDYRPQLLIELYTGMRMGEINALRPDSVDFNRKLILINSTVSKAENGKVFIKENGAKTYKGIREIPMNTMVEPILRKAIQEMRKNKEGLIFYDYFKGQIVPTTNVNCFYKRLCEKANVEFNGQHSLRHTFATRCIEAGVPPVVLKNWLGHKDIHVTLDTYADVFDRMHFGAIEKFDNYISVIEKRQEEVITQEEAENNVGDELGTGKVFEYEIQ